MIIGLGYKKRSGKDTIGDILEEEFGFKKASFASPLKELCSLLVDWDADLTPWAVKYGLDIDSHTFQFLNTRSLPYRLFKPDSTGKLRTLLQYVGTDVLRQTYSDTFWIDCMEREGNIVITDMRFKNEFDFCDIRIRVDRDTGLTDYHASENDLDGVEFDYIIDNNEDLDTLKQKVRSLLGDILCYQETSTKE